MRDFHSPLSGKIVLNTETGKRGSLETNLIIHEKFSKVVLYIRATCLHLFIHHENFNKSASLNSGKRK